SFEIVFGLYIETHIQHNGGVSILKNGFSYFWLGSYMLNFWNIFPRSCDEHILTWSAISKLLLRQGERLITLDIDCSPNIPASVYLDIFGNSSDSSLTRIQELNIGRITDWTIFERLVSRIKNIQRFKFDNSDSAPMP